MKILFDKRTYNKGSSYSKYIDEFLYNIKSINSENEFFILDNQKSEIIDFYIDSDIFSFSDYFKLNKILKYNSIDLIVSFSYKRTIIKWVKSIIILEGLKDVLYEFDNISNLFKRYFTVFFYKLSLKKSDNIICFSETTKSEINEKLNINDSKISIMRPSFLTALETKIDMDIKSKHNLKNDYIIYEWDLWSNKNLFRLLEAISILDNKLNLLILWNNLSWDLSLRNKVIDLKIDDRVLFLWDIKDSEKYAYYKNSILFVFPSLYESFPFDLSYAISYNTLLLLNSISSLESIFEDNAFYCKAFNISDIVKNIDYIIWSDTKVDYDIFRDKYNIEKSINDFDKIINILK